MTDNTIISQHPGGYATDPHLSPDVREFLKPLNAGGPPLESLSKEDARNVLASVQASVNVDLSGIAESERTISYDGHTLVLNIVRPEGSTEVLPVFMFIHGGGWILGDYPTHKRMVRDLVMLTGYAGVFVNYTRSPEAKYPQALHEIHAAARWLVQHGEELAIDPNRMGIVGNSVGGNMTVATTDPAKRKEIYASPLQATVEQLKGLPPTSIQVAENDILRDEGEALGRALDEAGVPVTTIRYNGVIHDFGLLNGLAALPQTRSLFLHAAAELKKYLQPM